jgi:hypothetical protein
MHSQDTEVQFWEERAQCNALSRSYLWGSIVSDNDLLLVTDIYFKLF